MREAEAAGRHADVVDQALQLGGGDFFADGFLHDVGEPRGLLNARAGAGAEVQADLSGVHIWEKILSEKRQQQPGAAAENQEPERDRAAMR